MSSRLTKSSSKTPGRKVVALAAPQVQIATQLYSHPLVVVESVALQTEWLLNFAKKKKLLHKRRSKPIDALNVNKQRHGKHKMPLFTSHTVPSKPSNLVCHTNKVPPSSAPTMVLHGDTATDSNSQDENEGLPHHHHQTPCPCPCPAPFTSNHNHNDTPSPDHQQPCLSCSPSTQPGKKHPHPDDSDLETEEVVHKAHKINEKSRQPKAGDYNNMAKEIILQAATIYRCLLSTENGFPELAVETEFVKSAWEDANKESGMPTLALTPDIAKIIKACGSQARGEAKEKTKSFVAEELKREKGFIYEDMPLDRDGPRKGMYYHSIIQKAVNAMWFQNKCDEGVLLTEMFKPIPVPAIAFVLIAIEANINEWLTGKKTSVTFWADEYRSIYKGHIEALEDYGRHTKKHDLIGRLQRRLFNYGRHHAGVPPTELNMPAIPASAYATALKEYEDMEEMDSKGDGLSW
ncbi:hypothetical protein BYT27DRAFT_7253852 [Phlegmacium glaucopus]|nr:hypothetical protein BYT27DRAFT_7253852 [Phlegmacium glaucopus]